MESWVTTVNSMSSGRSGSEHEGAPAVLRRKISFVPSGGLKIDPRSALRVKACEVVAVVVELLVEAKNANGFAWAASDSKWD
jgi:hypothetical protein